MEEAKHTEKTVTEKTEPWHKPKNGSVFPAKRKTVKKMMWDRVVEPSADKGSKMVSPPAASSSNKNNSVHPSSSQLSDDMAD